MRLLCMCKVVSTSVPPRDPYETQSAKLCDVSERSLTPTRLKAGMKAARNGLYRL